MRARFKPLARLARCVTDYALPPRCPGCGVIVEDDHRFCLPCWQKMTFLSAPCCERCGLPFAYDMGKGALCGACMAEPPGIDRARAVLAYGDLARTVALKLKYGRRIGLARLIAKHMIHHVSLENRADMLIVPVPLHRWRLWWRGFNQSALIANHLARLTGIKVDKEMLLRSRHTPALRGMNPRARHKAVQGAFRLNDDSAPLSDRIVILIDDIHTSGATANACAAVLRKGGAKSVQLLCWARVLPDLDAIAD